MSQDLIDVFLTHPTLLLCDSARLYPKIESNEVIGMYFDNVSPTGLATALGFADGDVILAVDGLPFTSEEDFTAIALEITEANAVTVTVRRGTTVLERDFERDG